MSDDTRKNKRTKYQKLNDDAQKSLDEIKAIHEKVSNFLSGIESQYKTEVKPKIDAISTASGKISDIQNEAQKSHDEIAKLYSEVSEFHDDIFTDDEESKENSYKTSIQGFSDSIKSSDAEIDEIKEKITKGYYDVFGKEEKQSRKIGANEDAGAIVLSANEKKIVDKNGVKWIITTNHVDGMLDSINGLIGSTKAFLDDSMNDFSEKMRTWEGKIENLYEQIESHLPNATSIGLAYSYDKAKNEHAKKATTWELVFGVTIGVILLVFILANIPDAIQYYHSGVNPLSLDSLKLKSLQLLPFVLPLLWFALHANKVANEHRHLREEYTHKWVAATAYVGMKKQVEDIADEDDKLLLRLLHNTVTIHSQNPNSFFMRKDKTENPVLRLLSCIPSKNIANFLGIKEIENVAKFVSQTGTSLEKILLSEKKRDDAPKT